MKQSHQKPLLRPHVLDGTVDPHFAKYYLDSGELDIHELTHRYFGQIVGVPRTTKNKMTLVPVSIVEFRYSKDGTNFNIHMMAREINSDGLKTYKLNNIICKWDIPTMGIINYKDRILSITYGANRDWRRGLSLNGLRVNDPLRYDSMILQNLGGNCSGLPPRSSILTELYNPVYFSFTRALELVNSGVKMSAAISPKYFISISSLSENLIIGYKGHLIGKIVDDKIQLHVGAKHLYEELSEYYSCEIKREINIGD